MNIYELIKKHNIDTKGADYGTVAKHLSEEARAKFAVDCEAMEAKENRLYVQAVYDLFNEMQSVGSNQLLDDASIELKAAYLSEEQ